MRDIVGGPYIIHLCGVVTARTQSRQSLIEGRPTYTGDIVGGRSALASTIVAFCHSTEAKQAVMAGQLTAVVVCTHGQRAVEQRPRIAAARGVFDTVSHWRTRTGRNHMPAGPGCQRGVGLLWASPRGKSYDNSHQGHRRWALSSTSVALSQQGS